MIADVSIMKPEMGGDLNMSPEKLNSIRLDVEERPSIRNMMLNSVLPRLFLRHIF